MNFAGLNAFGVFAAAGASFLFGGVWYGLLANQWMAAADVDFDEMRKRSGHLVTLYVITLLAQIVMALVLAGTMGHLGPGQVTVKNGIISGALMWAGFVMPSLLVNHVFQGARRSLTFIDGGHWLGVLLLQGAIIGWLGVG
ncbi:MAG: DUF1761 domain-containing protein [Hyphomicrobiaceae bacterium]